MIILVKFCEQFPSPQNMVMFDNPIQEEEVDDDNEEDEEWKFTSENSASILLERQFMLHKFLLLRPDEEFLRDKNIIPSLSSNDRQELRGKIENQLARRISQRPTQEELVNKHILFGEFFSFMQI
jgi:hypothetical protein